MIDEVPVENVGSLRLWQLAPPARLPLDPHGVREDGDMHEPAVMHVWDCQSGRLRADAAA